jgi:polar amino acid transport system substrate-binding protein
MKLSFLSTFLLVLLFLSFNTHAQKTFTFCYDPYPPYTLGKSGTPTGGLKVQLINAVFNEIDEAQAEVILLPWKQCQNQAKLGNIDGILPLFKK